MTEAKQHYLERMGQYAPVISTIDTETPCLYRINNPKWSVGIGNDRTADDVDVALFVQGFKEVQAEADENKDLPNEA